MRHSTFKIVMAILLLSILPSSNIAYSYTEEADLPNELLVKYTSEPHLLAETRALQEVETVEMIAPQVELLTFQADADMAVIRTQLENDPSIEYVEPNYERDLLSTMNDPYISSQWWIPHVKAESMWEYAGAQQQKIVVAVIDSGVDIHHEDLKNRIEPGSYDFYSRTEAVIDLFGHGTKVAGVIAAEAGNGLGVSGVVGPYNVSILPIKVVGSNGKGKVSAVVEAVNYAVSHNVDIMNLSLGGKSSSRIEQEAIQRALDAGIVVVAAAGNDALKGNPIMYPAAYDKVISVGAINENDQRARFSSYNPFVDLVAPGERIWTTDLYDSYDWDSGTSFSAPIISGTVAMMKAVKPELSNDEISNLLTTTARDLGEPGRDEHFGTGLLDIEKLVNQLMGTSFVGDFPDKTVPVTHEFTVTFNQELVPDKDYRQAILISRKPDGSEPITSFTTKVDASDPTKLYITPVSNWAYGHYYLTVTTDMRNKDNKPLKNQVQMKFSVE